MFAAVDSKLAPLNRSKNMCQVSLQLINQAVVDDSAKEVSHALLPLFFERNHLQAWPFMP